MAGETLLDAKAVTRKTTLSTSSIYRLVGAKAFPEPVRLGPQTVRWRESEVDQWIAALPRAGAETAGEQA